MAIRKIVVEHDFDLRSEPVLHSNCIEITSFDSKLEGLINDLIETLHSCGENAVGLAAPQVGILEKLAVIEFEKKIYVLINPKIIEEVGSEAGIEGCLSYPNKWALVERPKFIKVETHDEKGNLKTVEADGFLARVFCHEIDHLYGKVFLDKASKVFSKEELDQLIEKNKNKSNADV